MYDDFQCVLLFFFQLCQTGIAFSVTTFPFCHIPLLLRAINVKIQLTVKVPLLTLMYIFLYISYI